MAFVMKRNGYYVLRDKRKNLWKKLGNISFAEAKQVLNDYQNKKTRFEIGLPLDAVDITFEELKVEYLEDIKPLKAETTYNKEKEILDLFSRTLGKQKIGSFTTEALERFLQSQKYRPSTFHDRTKVLKNLFKMATQKEYLEENPAAKVRLPKLPELVPKAISPEIVEKLFKHMSGRILAYYKLLYYTGLRPSEAIRLKSSEIDLKQGRILIPKSKSNRFRVVPIHKTLKPFLKPLMENEFLFPGTTSGHQKSMKSGLDRAIREAKLKNHGVSRYAFRHTFATQVLSKTGGNIRAVQTLLGHSKITMTERYAHVLDEQLKTAVDSL